MTKRLFVDFQEGIGLCLTWNVAARYPWYLLFWLSAQPLLSSPLRHCPDPVSAGSPAICLAWKRRKNSQSQVHNPADRYHILYYMKTYFIIWMNDSPFFQLGIHFKLHTVCYCRQKAAIEEGLEDEFHFGSYGNKRKHFSVNYLCNQLIFNCMNFLLSPCACTTRSYSCPSSATLRYLLTQESKSQVICTYHSFI